MISTTIEKAINQQINQELAASYTYLAMSAWFDRLHLDGFAAFMLRQSQDEQQHAHRLFRYLLDRQGDVHLDAIEQPCEGYEGTRQVIEASLKLEQTNTTAIYALYDAARQEEDFATLSHLQWFLDEQVEEERVMSDLLGRIDLAGDDKAAMLMLDDRVNSLPKPLQPKGSTM